MNCLITGGSSLLGKYLKQTRPEGINLYSTWFSNPVEEANYHLDVCNNRQVNGVFERVKPNVVIHCAAIGSVDYTEKYFTETRDTNVLGTESILRAAEDFGAKFIFISSNAVFSGDHPPYSEKDERKPSNRYGSIKREAENLVMRSRHWVIIRPFLMYGWPYSGGRPNWLTIILEHLKMGKAVELVNDVYWQPSHAEDVAQTIWKLIDQEGVFHVASDEKLSLYEFGLKIAEVWGYEPFLIQPLSSSKLNWLAKRPIDSTFNLDKIHELGIRLRGVKEGLQSLKGEK